MSTILTRFELQMPLFGDATPNLQNAAATFVANMQTLCNLEVGDGTIARGDGTFTQVRLYYGLITAAQQATALGFLNALNAAIGTPVLCMIWNVTTEP